MRRLILISAAIVVAGLPRVAFAAPAPVAPSAGNLSSISLIGTLDSRDRPRVFARFDRTLPAAHGDLRGARVRLVVDAQVAVRGTSVSGHVHTVLMRKLGSLRRTGSWKIELPLSRGQAERIEKAATDPSELEVHGTAIQTVLPPAGGPLPLSRISGVTGASDAEFEGQEIVNGTVEAYYVVEKPECEHSQGGCVATPAPGTWTNPSWAGYEHGEDNEHGDLSMTSCNGGWSGACEGIFGGIFAAKEVDSISADPEGTAYFNLSEGTNGITPWMEIAAGYNEHDHSAPPISCGIANSAYVPTHVADGPVPTVFCSRTIEEGENEEEEVPSIAYDSYVVTTVWPSGSTPPSPTG